MYFYTKETATEKINAVIENYHRCIALIDVIKPVIAKYDGKVINKKFDIAMESATGARIRWNYFYDSFEIKVLANGYGVPDDGISPYMLPGDDNYYYLTSGAFIGGTFKKERCMRCNGYEVTTITEAGNHRLIAENMNRALDRRRAELEAHIKAIGAALEMVNTYKAEIAEMEKKIDKIQEIPHEVRRIFDLNVTISHN